MTRVDRKPHVNPQQEQRYKPDVHPEVGLRLCVIDLRFEVCGNHSGQAAPSLYRLQAINHACVNLKRAQHFAESCWQNILRLSWEFASNLKQYLRSFCR